jgi:hypothetical protein
MKKAAIILFGILLLISFTDEATPIDVKKNDAIPITLWPRDAFPQIEQQGARQFTAAQVDTYCIVWYDFESMDWQGWTKFDVTAQLDTFTHIDNFAGLNGGDFGGLVPRDGSRSFWCGARPDPDDEELCSWESLPGYGYAWGQYLVTEAFAFTSPLTFSYSGFFHSEYEWDYTYVEYDAGDGTWEELASYTGMVDTVASHQLFLPQAQTKLRFRFNSDEYLDDSFGLNSDGAFVVDNLEISDFNGTIDYEDCEDCELFSTSCGLWHADVRPGFGNYSGLANLLTDKDPCGENFTTQIMFFAGSPHPSAAYPGLYDTPFCKGPGGVSDPCQHEAVFSPIIDLNYYSSMCDENQDTPISDPSTLGGTILRFTVYRDLPDNVWYGWYVRSIDETGCPGYWENRGYVYRGFDKDFYFQEEDIGALITEDRIQIALSVQDNCSPFYDPGYCAEHTPAPWFDNIRIYRYETVGPQWNYPIDAVFHDAFPEDRYDLESFCRVDMSRWPLFGGSKPGDSTTITCAAPQAGGLAEDANGAKVYMHARATYVGDPANPKTLPHDASWQGTYGTYITTDSNGWVIIQGDSAISRLVDDEWPDRYSFDINDSLLTRGFIVEYYFTAEDADGNVSLHPERAQSHDEFYSFVTLPSLRSDILLMTISHSMGPAEVTDAFEAFYKQSFDAVIPPENSPDHFTVINGFTNLARLSSLNSMQHYRKVIYDAGGYNDWGNCQLIVDWLNTTPHDVGLWMLGEDFAAAFDNDATVCGLELMSDICGVDLVHDSYYELTGGFLAGGNVSPLLRTVSNPYTNPLHQDSLYIDGGCSLINPFDVLEKTANGEYALKYPDFDGQQYYAAIQSESVNDHGYPMKTMWFGFSLIFIRDAAPPSPGEGIVRNRLMEAVVEWLGNDVNDNITDSGELPKAYNLAQNFPNPFNPSTMIMFNMKEKGLVTLKIYNVAGQLVRTLVDDVREAGSYKVPWDGRNNEGISIASGVYFYKMETEKYSKTKKMVMLR